jgi:hypothetical protein
MVYKFKSKASGDVIMLAAPGDQLMRLLGREPAAQGIIEVAHMPQALQALQAAIDQEAQAGKGPQVGDATGGAEADPSNPAAVALRQRLWPMLDMLKRAHAAQEPVVWGV